MYYSFELIMSNELKKGSTEELPKPDTLRDLISRDT